MKSSCIWSTTCFPPFRATTRMIRDGTVEGILHVTVAVKTSSFGMGITMTKAQPMAVARKKRKRRERSLPVIHEYVPDPHTHCSKTGDFGLHRNENLKSLQQYGRSATMFDVSSSSSAPRPDTPEWQRRWERDMRPVPSPVRLETLPHLRAWNSMPLPTNDIEAYFIDWQESFRRTSNAQRNGRRTKGSKHGSFSRIGGTNSRQTSTPLPDNENLDKIDKMSLSSMAVDNFKWLHKTDARTDSYMKFVRNMWHDVPRKGSKQWFLGQDSKLETEIVPKRSKRRNRFRIKTTPRLPPIKA